jgi:cytochrome c-type biogenesis protein
MAKAKGRMQGLLGGLACTLGIMSSFAFYAITASFIGTFFIAHYPVFSTLLGIFIIILGIIMLTPLRELFSRIVAFRVGKLTPFAIGATYTFIAAPCAFPVLLSMISLFATILDFLLTILSAILFSIGAGIPFIIVGVGMEKVAMSRKLSWLIPYTPYFSGILLIVLGALLALGL